MNAPYTARWETIVIKMVFLVLAFVFLALGAVGVAIPVLPTTPFLLLAGFCFARGSRRLNRWFVGTKLYQKHLESFVHSRSMTRKTKLCILLPASAMLLAAIVLVPVLPMRIFIGALMAFKYFYFLFCIKTIPAGAATA